MEQGRKDTKNHSDQMIEGIMFALRELIPSVTINCQTVASVDDLRKQGFITKGISGNAGLHYGDNEVLIWFDLSHGAVCLLHVSRKHYP